jgi:hypothetical protein
MYEYFVLIFCMSLKEAKNIFFSTICGPIHQFVHLGPMEKVGITSLIR